MLASRAAKGILIVFAIIDVLFITEYFCPFFYVVMHGKSSKTLVISFDLSPHPT